MTTYNIDITTVELERLKQNDHIILTDSIDEECAFCGEQIQINIHLWRAVGNLPGS